MAYTREQWARTFLGGVGNPNPPDWLVNWAVAWTLHEWQQSSESDCVANLLNTHQAGWPKCHGDNYQVARFPDMHTGALVNAAVLNSNHLGYKELKQAIIRADKAALTTPSADVNRALYTWVHGDTASVGPAYGGTVHNWVNEGASGRNEVIQGEAGTVSPPPAVDYCAKLPVNQQAQCYIKVAAMCNATSLHIPAGADATIAQNLIDGCKACVGYAIANPNTGTPDQCVKEFDYSNPASGTPDNGANPSNWPNWLINPDWARIGKGVVGVLLLLAGLGLLIGILVGKVENTATFKTASRVAKVVAA